HNLFHTLAEAGNQSQLDRHGLVLELCGCMVQVVGSNEGTATSSCSPTSHPSSLDADTRPADQVTRRGDRVHKARQLRNLLLLRGSVDSEVPLADDALARARDSPRRSREAPRQQHLRRVDARTQQCSVVLAALVAVELAGALVPASRIPELAELSGLADHHTGDASSVRQATSTSRLREGIQEHRAGVERLHEQILLVVVVRNPPVTDLALRRVDDTGRQTREDAVVERHAAEVLNSLADNVRVPLAELLVADVDPSSGSRDLVDPL